MKEYSSALNCKSFKGYISFKLGYMIIEIHYFCFELYISKWKVFLLPTSHLFSPFIRVYQSTNESFTMYFSNDLLETGDCAGPLHCVQASGPAVPCQDSSAVLIHALGGCWQLGQGAKLRCSHNAGDREGLEISPAKMGLRLNMQRDSASHSSELPEKVEGKGEEAREYYLYVFGPPVCLWQSMAWSELILREVPNPWMDFVTSDKSRAAQISLLSCQLVPSVQAASMSPLAVGSLEFRFPKHPLFHI